LSYRYGVLLRSLLLPQAGVDAAAMRGVLEKSNLMHVAKAHLLMCCACDVAVLAAAAGWRGRSCHAWRA
jgi:hypothetical protein